MIISLLLVFFQLASALMTNFVCNPTLCPSSSRGDGICDTDCMSSFCNFDSNSTSNPILNPENSDCFELCTTNYSCSYSDLGNGICDENCNNPICGYDFGDCGYCSSNCKNYIGFQEDLRANCSNTCDNENCYYGLGSCKDCSPGCNNEMLGDNLCDKSCNVLSCNYDFGDCNNNQCSPGCELWMIGDKNCNEECSNLACNWDGGDCDCSQGCHPYMISNGICDEACDVSACGYDGGDCQKCAPGCLKSMLGDGVCNAACDVSDCHYDNYDCSCAEGCKRENYGQCKDSCMNSLCRYDTIDNTSQCQNTSQILFALHYGFIFKNLIANASPESCINNTSCLSNEVLDSSSCHANCRSNSCIYSWSKCKTYTCADSNCLTCNSNALGDCFKCKPNTYQFYGYCLASCPSGHEAINLLENYPVCLISKDYSTKENPAIYYVTSKQSTDIYGGNGTFNNPYASLALALASIYNDYAIIYLFNDGDHYLTCVDTTNPVSTVLSDTCNPLMKSFTIKNLLISSYDNSIISLKNKADRNLLLFTIISSTSLTVKSIAFNGKDLLSACPSSINPYCTYCANITQKTDGYYYSDQNTKVTNYVGRSFCNNYHTKQFFTVYSYAKLNMINVNITDFRMELKSIIYSFGGSITFRNVNFDNIRCYWADWSTQPSGKTSAIYFDDCGDPYYNCGSFEYTNGVVSRLNNGYENGYAQYSGFFCADKIRTVMMKNVTFINNIVWSPYTTTNTSSLIKLSTFRSIEIANCVFDTNCDRYGLIGLNPTSLTFMNNVNSYGELIDLMLYHVYIHDTTFKRHLNILFISYTSQLQRILLKNLLINECLVFSDRSLMYIGNDYYYTEYGEDTKKIINDTNGNIVTATFKKRDFIFKDSTITHSYFGSIGALYIARLVNSHIKNLTYESNGGFESQNVNTLLWRYYVADTNLYIKSLINNPTSVTGGCLWLVSFCYNHEASDCKFINNLAKCPNQDIYYKNCNNVNLTGFTFEGNWASNSKGVCIDNNYCTNVRVTNSTFKNNTNSSDKGFGALYFEYHENAYLENIIISNISASACSGIYFSGISLSLNNVTIESNSAISNLGIVCYTYKNYWNIVSAPITPILKITNSIFKENINLSSKGGVLYIAGYDGYFYSIGFYAKNNFFISNQAQIGSAIYINNDAILANDSFIESCKFISNTADKKGIIASLYMYGNLNILNSSFISNKIVDGSILYSKMTKDLKNSEEIKFNLTSCTFTDNSGKNILGFYGLDVYIYIETVQCIFQNNEGIVINLAQSYWKDTESIIENSKTMAGAVSLTSNSTAICEYTTFTNNTSTDKAGAIRAESSSYFACNHCNFDKNSARTGGVLYFDENSYFLIENSYFQHNLCTYQGAVIYIIGSENTCVLKNSKLLNNYAKTEGLIYILTSNIEIDSCEISNNTANNVSPVIYLSISNAIIINSQLNNQEGNYGSFIYLTSDSLLFIVNSSFINGKSYVSGGSIYALSSTLILQNSIFNNSISNNGNAILAFSASLNISQCQFLNTYTYSSGSGGVISIYGSDIYIENSFFENFTNSAIDGSEMTSLKVIDTSFKNSVSKWGGSISCINTDYVYIDSCNFNNNTSLYGGALYFTFTSNTVNSQSYEVISTRFVNNTSSAGGAIFVDNINIDIKSCIFHNNTAMNTYKNSVRDTSSGIGGAIKLGCSNFENCDFNIFSNDFVGNKADYEGGAVIWKEVMPKFENNSYEKNQAKYGENIASYPVSMKILNANWTGVLKDLASGQSIKTPLIIGLADHLGSIVATDNLSIGEIASISKGVVLSGDLKVKAANGIFNFSSFIISGEPGMNFSLEIQTNGIDASKSAKANDGLTYNSSIIVNVSLRNCTLGEATVGVNCIVCPTDFYSLDPNDEQCSSCPNEAICYGNYTIVPKPGYWRSDMLSKKFWSCPNSKACTGSDSQNISYTGNCLSGYTGNLCQSCSEGYYRSAKNECAKCQSLSTVIIKTSGISLGFFVVCSVMILMSKKSAYKPKSLSSVYIKIFINYIQLICLTTAFSLSWPKYVKHLFSVQNNASFISGDEIFSFDCLFYYNHIFKGENTEIFYQKLFIMAVLPIFIPFIAATIWCLILLWKRNWSLLMNNIITTSIIASFLVHPSLIKYYFSSFDCTELDYGKYWLAYDLNLRCWNEQHVFFISNIALPALILWGVGIPTICLFMIIKNKHKLSNISVRIKYGFLFNGYSSRNYYWEFVIIYRKIIIICCSVFLETVSVSLQAMTALFVLVVSLYIHCKNKPYSLDHLNRLEAISILVSALTIYCGLYYLTGSLDKFTEFVFFILIVSANAYFLIYWIMKAGNFYVSMIAKKIPFLNKRFHTQSYNIMSGLSFNNNKKRSECFSERVLSSYNNENLNLQDSNFKEIEDIMDEKIENIIKEESIEEINFENKHPEESDIEKSGIEGYLSVTKLIDTNKDEEIKYEEASLEDIKIEEK